MTTYVVTRKSSGEEITRYASGQISLTDLYPLDEFDHTEVDPETPPPPIVDWRITKLAFRNRFTQAEKVAIEIAALDDPSATMQQRSMAAALRASQLDVQAAQYIDLTREDTRTGVLQLEAAGLLAAGRALVILDTPPIETEVWNG